MNSKKKIGVLYKYDPNWMGGTIYVFNLLKALELAQNKGKELPLIVIFADRFTKKKLDFRFANLNYTLKYFNPPKWITLINKISFKITKNVIIPWRFRTSLDALFPVTRPWDYFKNTPIANQIYWIPDFQCFHLPEYFEESDIQARKKSYFETLANARKLVLSSESVLKDLHRFYPNLVYPTIGVLKFAVFNEVKGGYIETFDFDRPYFICPNQFWAHKNQEVILRAIKYLGKAVLPFYVVFTGKMFDSRNPKHFEDNIKPLLEDEFVQNNVKLLGFIDRDIQLSLIKNSIALIQPSRFEGWSTVIEDGMSLEINIIASNLEVNIEQLGSKGYFFNVDDEIELSNLIIEQYNNYPKRINYQYSEKQLKFAVDFLKIINS